MSLSWSIRNISFLLQNCIWLHDTVLYEKDDDPGAAAATFPALGIEYFLSICKIEKKPCYIHKMAPQSAIDIALKGIREKQWKAKSRAIKDSRIAATKAMHAYMPWL